MQTLLMYSNFSPSQTHVERLKILIPPRQVIVADCEETAITQANTTEIILGHRYLRQTLPHARKLKWIHTTAGGIDQLVSAELIRIAPLVTHSPIFSDVIAQHALSLAWAILRRIPEAVRQQDRHNWTTTFDMLPLPRVAMVLGMGHIGQTLGSLLKHHGLRVLGVARTSGTRTDAYCDELITDNTWRSRLAEVDLCILCLPLTRATYRFVDAGVIAALPDHAVIINVGRGATLDTIALQKALRSGRLGGAALDVVEQSPLLPSDPLWSTPRLLITPKVSVYHPQMQQRLEQFIEQQMMLYLNGEEPLYRVSREMLLESVLTTEGESKREIKT